MDVVLLVLAAVALALGAVLVRRRLKVLAWDRELEQAFGLPSEREMPRHRAL